MEARNVFNSQFTSCSTAISVLLFIILSSQISFAQDSPYNICSTKTLDRNKQITFLRTLGLSGETGECFSTQPINWISNEISQLPMANESTMELPFEIKTKLVPCGHGQKQTPVFENSSIQHYFTSRLIFNKQYAKVRLEARVFCGNFKPHPNSTNFPGFKISTETGMFIQIITHPSSPTEPLSNIMECEETTLILDQNESSGNCSCRSAELFHCDNLMECRFVAHWKSKKACRATGFQNLCNVTSFSLSDSSKTKGGILFCEPTQQHRHPYILFLPKPQKPESNPTISMTTNNTKTNLTEIQILDYDTENYEQLLKIFIVSPKNESEITRRSGAQIECRGPAFLPFLFLEGIFWNVTIENGESESNLLPNFNISDERIGNSAEGEKYVSSTLTILPDERNTSSVLNVTCQVALSDGGVFVQSNLTVNLEVYKPRITAYMSCKATAVVEFNCKADANVTYHDENNLKYQTKEKSLLDCQNETIICTATLKNGVQNSHNFTRGDCDNFVETIKNNCSKILEARILAKTTTTTTTTTTRAPPNSNSTPPNNGEGQKYQPIAAISSGLGVCILVFGICVIVLMRKNREQRAQLKMSDEDVNDFLQGNDSVHFLPYDTQLEIPRDQITIGTKVLGSGAFGKVVEGQYRETKVAIKTVNKSADIQYFKALLSEIKIMGFVGKHDNIVEMLGACTWDIKQRNVYVVFELCENGNLVHFLRKNRENFENQSQKPREKLHVDSRMTRMTQRLSMIMSSTSTNTSTTPPITRKITVRDLVRWSMEIASGMDVIAQKSIYHGDLAARNILLDENLKAKVGDFGLSRQLFEYSVYVQQTACPLPLKWMSIESLRDLEFSIQSDVWSYGITLWEIFSLGCQPYPNLDWNFASWQYLLDGGRMAKPEHASNSIYEIMLKCWNEKPSERPTFAQLKTMFEEEFRKI